MQYHHEWSLDLSNRQRTLFPEVQKLHAVGYLNISNNPLCSFSNIVESIRHLLPCIHLVICSSLNVGFCNTKKKELPTLSPVPLIASTSIVHRMLLVYLLPNVLCLDYVFITLQERQTAKTYFEQEGRFNMDLRTVPMSLLINTFGNDDFLSNLELCKAENWGEVLLRNSPCSIHEDPNYELNLIRTIAADLDAEIFAHYGKKISTKNILLRHRSINEDAERGGGIIAPWISNMVMHHDKNKHRRTLLLLSILFLLDTNDETCFKSIWELALWKPKYILCTKHQQNPTKSTQVYFETNFCPRCKQEHFLSAQEVLKLTKEIQMKLCTVFLAIYEIYGDLKLTKSAKKHLKYLGCKLNGLKSQPSNRILKEIEILSTCNGGDLIQNYCFCRQIDEQIKI